MNKDIVASFMKEFEHGISNLHNMYVGITYNEYLMEVLTQELESQTKSLLDKGEDEEVIKPILFYHVNEFFQKNKVVIPQKKNDYLCPGCQYRGKESFLETDKVHKCKLCTYEKLHNSDPSLDYFYSTFSIHNKSGYRCGDCKRFIPHPIDNSKLVKCPYLDCIFSDDISNLKKMHHPAATPSYLSDHAVPSVLSTLDTETLTKVMLIKSAIETESNGIPYNSSSFTIKHKILAYQSFNNLLDVYPKEMSAYLLDKTRSGGFQAKVFQEYIKLLEESFPFQIKKANKWYTIDSLLDSNLSLFDGISIFDSIVSSKLEIKNETKEFYIGSRKATYTEPFFIGKLLSVLDQKTGEPLTHKVAEYTFLKIKMKDIDPNTKVTVTHLRVPPHYQMGGMAYINRARKSIVDKAKASNE
jgi:hypothetical protein